MLEGLMAMLGVPKDAMIAAQSKIEDALRKIDEIHANTETILNRLASMEHGGPNDDELFDPLLIERKIHASDRSTAI